jgi:polysaccharide biosynthesis transport protein
MIKTREAMRDIANSWASPEAPSQDSGRIWPERMFPDDGVFGVFIRRWRVVATASVAGALAGLVWFQQTVPIYTATTTLLMEARRPNLMGTGSFVADAGFNEASMATELSLIRSFTVARRVVERFKLATDPEFIGSGGGRPAPASSLSGAETQSAIDAVLSGVQAQRVGGAWFINIGYSHQNPKVAMRLANAIAETYLADQLEARYQSARRATSWLSERVSQLRLQVEAAERAVAEHRAKYNLVAAAPSSLSDQQAVGINTELVTVHADAVQKRVRYEQARGILEGGRIESVAEVMQSPAIASFRASEAQTAHEEADLLTRYGPEHPEVRKVRAQRGDLRRQINAEIGRVVSSLKTDYELAQKKEETLEQSLHDLTGGKDSNDKAMIRLRELEREAQADKTLYETLLSRFKEAEQQTNLPGAETRVIAPALLPPAPSHPNLRHMLGLSTLIGLSLGCCFAFMLENIENGFATMEDVEETLQLPVLAMIPRLPRRKCMLDGEPVAIPEYVADKPLSRFSELIRSIRVSAQMSNIDKPPQLLLVTSSAPGEGKTTVTQCMVYSAAAAGQKVLAIDCDLRHPTLSKDFGLSDGPGLSDLLSGQVSANQAFCKGPLPNLTILPAGTIARHPPDLLGSEKLRALLEEMKTHFDLVVLDGPPVAPVVDCVLLSRLVDKIVFVVQWRKTPRNVVQRVVNALNEGAPKIAGVALNDVQLRKGAPYSASYGYYSRPYYRYYEQ